MIKYLPKKNNFFLIIIYMDKIKYIKYKFKYNFLNIKKLILNSDIDEKKKNKLINDIYKINDNFKIKYYKYSNHKGGSLKLDKLIEILNNKITDFSNINSRIKEATEKAQEAIQNANTAKNAAGKAASDADKAATKAKESATKATQATKTATEAAKKATESATEATQATSQATEALQHAKEATEKATKATKTATEATEEANAAKDEAKTAATTATTAAATTSEVAKKTVEIANILVNGRKIKIKYDITNEINFDKSIIESDKNITEEKETIFNATNDFRNNINKLDLDQIM